MKKAPVARSLMLWNSSLAGRGSYYFFFLEGAAFFFATGFLVAFFIDVILPNLKFAIRKSQCDSYIRLFKKIVKEKMHDTALIPAS